MRAPMKAAVLSAAMSLLSTSAHAHMMPAQTITLNVRGAAVYGALSIPASALTGWDDDRDGRMSAAELHRHRDGILRQLDAGIAIANGGEAGRRDLLQPSVELDERDTRASGTHLLVLVKQSFAAVPTTVRFRIALFGRGNDEQRFIVRASGAGAPEVAIVTSTDASHEFFASMPVVVARLFAPVRDFVHRLFT